MADPDFTGTARVRALARYAGLPLPKDREAVVASILDAWAAAADELSRKMSAAAHQDLLPAVQFAHAADVGDEAA